MLDQGQKSHLQLLRVAELQQIVFRMSSLYSSTERRNQTLSVSVSPKHDPVSWVSDTSLQKKGVLCSVAAP